MAMASRQLVLAVVCILFLVPGGGLRAREWWQFWKRKDPKQVSTSSREKQVQTKDAGRRAKAIEQRRKKAQEVRVKQDKKRREAFIKGQREARREMERKQRKLHQKFRRLRRSQNRALKKARPSLSISRSRQKETIGGTRSRATRGFFRNR